jgi:dipeptidyl aminopeptidase/acylaminoacyl peptidase
MRHPSGVSLICASIATLLVGTAWAVPAEKRLPTLDDIHVLRDVYDPQISPDGTWVAYTVRSTDVKKDEHNADIWMTTWDGKQSLRLTSSPDGENTPRFSPDGRYLAFLSSRDDPAESDQVWLMNRSGGEAEKLTEFKGGVSDFAWSPDGRRLAIIVEDPDPDACDSEKEKCEDKVPKPIVIDRYRFKEDEIGYLTTVREHLYLFEVATRKADLLTPGEFNEVLPSWSPDGKAIAFVSKRGKDVDRLNNWDLYVIEARSGSTPRQITSFEGPDSDPEWESPPVWSPDGKLIAYLQGGPQKRIYYAVHKLAVVPASGGSPRLLSPALDRNIGTPHWSADGASIWFLLEDDGSVHLARLPAAGGKVERVVDGHRVISGLTLGPGGRVAVIDSTPQTPPEVFALQGSSLRPLSRQNEGLMSQIRLAATEQVTVKSKDGTAITTFVVRPPDAPAGRRSPAVLRVHGGPVDQFQNEFRIDWQLLAARGYVVLGANPRGSSGRGEEFSMAIYADWGNKDAQDVLAAVDHAVAQGIADPDKLGIGGWSYGGMLTNYVIAQDTRFKAATSGAGISNILAGYGTDQYIVEYDQELGPPWTALESWLRVSFPFLHADRIVTPTLFLCGEKDFNVPLLNSEQMYQALRSLGRETQLIIYPGEYHGLDRPSYERDRLERYLAWYDKHLR